MFQIFDKGDIPGLQEVILNDLKFPGGEIHFNTRHAFTGGIVHIKTDLADSDAIMKLVLVADTFRHLNKTLELLYTPYARQDRRTSHGEPFSFRAFAKLINSLGFKKITVYDPHSDVTPALLDNVFVVNRLELVKQNMMIDPILKNGNAVIMSPDAGAIKTNGYVAAHYKVPHFHATKERNTETGEISHTVVHAPLAALEDKDVVILDDLCDGGKTFIELAKVLKKNFNPRTISLYVTHGIFSKGFEVFEDYFDNISWHYKKESK